MIQERCCDCEARFDSKSAADEHWMSSEHNCLRSAPWNDYNIKWDEVIKALSKAVRILK